MGHRGDKKLFLELSFLLFLLSVILSSTAQLNNEDLCEVSLRLDCKCSRNNDTKTERIVCESRKLGSIPKNFSAPAELKITGDDVEVVDEVPYPSLVSLHLDNNRIRFIRGYAFRKLDRLEVLSLAENDLSNLRNETFFGLTALTLLVLHGNPLYEITADTLTGSSLPSLQIVRLSSCSIYAVESHSFAGLVELQQLDLRDNRIESFAIVGELPKLTAIDLSMNRIREIDVDSFVNLVGSAVRDLNLTGNRLTVLGKNAFVSLKDNLTDLIIRGNRLTTIEPGSLRRLSRLTSLDLAFNSLTVLDGDELPFGSLDKILVHDNPWDCDPCTNSWLTENDDVQLWNMESSLTCATSGRNLIKNENAEEQEQETPFSHCSPTTTTGRTSSLTAVKVSVICVAVLTTVCVALVVRWRLKRNRQSTHAPCNGSKRKRPAVNGERMALAFSNNVDDDDTKKFTIVDADEEEDEHEEL